MGDLDQPRSLVTLSARGNLAETLSVEESPVTHSESICCMGYCRSMSIQPEEVPLHLTVIETSTDAWLIDVRSVAEAPGSGTLLMNLILETNINEDGERIRTRKLGIVVDASMLFDPDLLPDFLKQIGRWIETTEGDGFCSR
jgi:hypothetical protein